MSEQLEQLAFETAEKVLTAQTNEANRFRTRQAVYTELIKAAMTTATADLRREVEELQTSRRNAYLEEHKAREAAETDNDRLRKALEFIGSQSMCECWDVPGMGSLHYKWIGCKLYHSDDQNEWCLCCEAHAALKPAQ